MPGVLASVSGGIDSAAALYLAITQEGIRPGDVSAYHLRNIRRLNTATADAEGIAFSRVRSWFDSRYPGINWETGACIDWRGWTAPPGNASMHALIRGSMARKFGCSIVLLGGIADDWHPDNDPDARFAEHDRVLAAVCNAKPMQPTRHMTKAEVMRAIPEDLLALTWSCSDAVKRYGGVHRCGGGLHYLCNECSLVKAALPVGSLGMEWFETAIK